MRPATVVFYFRSRPAGPCFFSWTSSLILDSSTPIWLNQASHQVQLVPEGALGCWGFIWVMAEALSTHQSVWDMFWPCSCVPPSCDLSLLHWALVVLFQFGCKSVQVLTTKWINFSIKGKCARLTYKVNFRTLSERMWFAFTQKWFLKRTSHHSLFWWPYVELCCLKMTLDISEVHIKGKVHPKIIIFCYHLF